MRKTIDLDPVLMQLPQFLVLIAGVISLGLALLLIAMVWQFTIVVPYMSLLLAGLALGIALLLIILAGLLLLRATRR